MTHTPTGTPPIRGRSVDTGQVKSPPQTTGKGEARSLGQAAPAMSSHAQLLTVTPLNNDATIVPMTPQQIAAHQAPTAPVSEAMAPQSQPVTFPPRLMTSSEIDALGPRRPKKPESLSFYRMTSSRTDEMITFKFTVRGVDADSPFTRGIIERLKSMTEGKFCGFSTFTAVSKKGGGVEISFKAQCLSLSDRIAHVSYRDVSTLFENLFDLGISVHDVGLSRNDAICAQLSSQSWHCIRSASAITPRAELIGHLLTTGYFDLAFRLICDLTEACNGSASHHLLGSTKLRQLGALELIVFPNRNISKGFVEMVFKILKENPELLKHRHSLAQAGRMLLRSIADPDFQSDSHADLRKKVFAAIGDFRKRRSQKEAEALLQDLLDMPSGDRGELLLDPRVRQLLLIAFPDLHSLFEKIEANAYEVFLDRVKPLENCGLAFAGNFGQPVEIIGTHFDSYAIYNLLELAEAAVLCAGQIDCATGVLLTLSEIVLDEQWDHVLKRAENLRDRIQLIVKSEMPDQFDAIKALTDKAIAELKVWFG